MTTPEIWTAREIAEWLGLCQRYVAEKLAKQKDFPRPLPIGRHRWFKHEVIEWADQMRNRRAA